MSSRAVIILSLGLNAVLGATTFYYVTRPAPVAPAPAEPAVKVVKQKVEVTTVETNTVVKQINWQVVESADYKKYIANLRSIGCPEETIHDIIKADVDKLYAARRKEITKPKAEFKYWETGMQALMGDATNPEIVDKLQALALEKRALLKELLGIDVADKPDLMAAAFNPIERLLNFLPDEKQTKVLEMMQQFQAKMMKSMSGGAPDEQDRKNLMAAQKEYEASLEKMLSPQEFEQYQLRLSQTSMMMRMELDGFTPSEQEFKDLFKLRKGFDDENGGMFGMMDQSKEGREKYQAAQKELNEQIKNTLGEARYADYEREKDYQYKGVSKFVQRQNLPKEAAVKVWDTKKTAEAEAGKVRNNASLSQEQKNAALQGIHEATQQNLQQTLGADAYQKFQESNNASWLKNIAPRPKPAGQ
ncbi:MAG: hypothetical protein K0Q55_3277 [Verrucomicrobia bacterium]|nr:hypothetical protein [Verrucomicrobiota bacterium]